MATKYLDEGGLSTLVGQIKTYVKNEKPVVPTKVSDLLNDSGFITVGDIPPATEFYTEIQVLSSGSSTLTFTNSNITTTSTIEVFASKFGVIPSDIVVSAGQVEITFEPPSEDVSIKIRISD